MDIRSTKMTDLDEIMEIYKEAREFMALNGNSEQWGDNYPYRSQIEQDINEGKSYVCTDNGMIVGTFFFDINDDPYYDVIDNGQWLNNEEYGVIHRIATRTNVKGTATCCLNWVLEKCQNIRIDTHEKNIPMQNFLYKNGFKKCGIIYVRDNSARLAFQREA